VDGLRARARYIATPKIEAVPWARPYRVMVSTGGVVVQGLLQPAYETLTGHPTFH
jgi:hypothetical protein